MPLATALVGLAGFALCTLSGYLSVRRGLRWASPLVILGAIIGIGSNVCYLIRSLAHLGVVDTFRHNFESTLLLATLLGLVAFGCYLARKLRGLDGLLFVLATLVEGGALLVMHRTGGGNANYKPWFISHALAFQVSAACFLAGGAAGVAYLLTSYVLRRKRSPQMVGAVAPLEAIERFEWWAIVMGFPLFTFGILTGICEMVRSKNPGPRAWLADPLIIASFFTWAVYAVLIAAMWLSPRMRGRRAATLVSCGMVLIVVVFLVIEFVSPLHQ